jgi:hypothetical protein
LSIHSFFKKEAKISQKNEKNLLESLNIPIYFQKYLGKFLIFKEDFMKKLILGALVVAGLVTSVYAGVKRIYVGSHSNGRAMYVIECTNGSRYSEINLHSNGYWYSGWANMGDDYRNLSINQVASKKCN